MLNIGRLRQIIRKSGDHKMILIDGDDALVVMTIQEYERLVGITQENGHSNPETVEVTSASHNNRPRILGSHNNDLFDSISVKYQKNPEAVNKDVTEWFEQHSQLRVNDTIDLVDDLDNDLDSDIRYERLLTQ